MRTSSMFKVYMFPIEEKKLKILTLTLLLMVALPVAPPDQLAASRDVYERLAAAMGQRRCMAALVATASTYHIRCHDRYCTASWLLFCSRALSYLL